MNKARQSQLDKRMATERGMPKHLMNEIMNPSNPLWFGTNKNKFKPVFEKGHGPERNPNKRLSTATATAPTKPDFYATQKKTSLSKNLNAGNRKQEKKLVHKENENR